MAVELMWVEENLLTLLKQGKITLEEYRLLCTSLAEESREDIDDGS